MFCLKQHNENPLFAKYGIVNREKFSGVKQTLKVIQLDYVHVFQGRGGSRKQFFLKEGDRFIFNFQICLLLTIWTSTKWNASAASDTCMLHWSVLWSVLFQGRGGSRKQFFLKEGVRCLLLTIWTTTKWNASAVSDHWIYPGASTSCPPSPQPPSSLSLSVLTHLVSFGRLLKRFVRWLFRLVLSYNERPTSESFPVKH